MTYYCFCISPKYEYPSWPCRASWVLCVCVCSRDGRDFNIIALNSHQHLPSQPRCLPSYRHCPAYLPRPFIHSSPNCCKTWVVHTWFFATQSNFILSIFWLLQQLTCLVSLYLQLWIMLPASPPLPVLLCLVWSSTVTQLHHLSVHLPPYWFFGHYDDALLTPWSVFLFGSSNKLRDIMADAHFSPSKKVPRPFQ